MACKRAQAIDAITSGSADMVSLARALVLNPRLAEVWLNDKGEDPVFPIFDSPPHGGVTAWYTMRLTALGEDRESEFDLDPQSAIELYEERDEQRSILWNAKYRQK